MSETDSEDLEVQSDDEPVKRGPTVAFSAAAATIGTHAHESTGNLEDMSKKQLIKLMTSYGKHELRDTNYKISMIAERMSHFDAAIKELEDSIKSKTEKDIKYRQMSKDPKRLIKTLEKSIKRNKEKIAELQLEVDEFEKKKAMKAIEQQSAKREINKKLVNDVYKYLEKNSDEIIIKLLETFVALLRNRSSAGKTDVELYFRKFEGLLTAMNKINPREIKGENARIYADKIHAIRIHFSEDEVYHKYIPFLVFLNQTVAIVLLAVEEKEIEHQITLLEADNKAKEKEIDEIETFDKHVDDHDVIDFSEQVKSEQEQLNLLSNHRELLKLRLSKLLRYSQNFERYYFDAIKDPKKINSNMLDKIDKMDDLDKVKYKERDVGSLSKSVTRISKEALSSNAPAPKGTKNRTKFEVNDSSRGDDEEESEGDDEEAEGEDDSEDADEEEPSQTVTESNYDEEEDDE